MAIALKTPMVLATDEDLVRVARDNPGYRFERQEDGTVIVSPTYTSGGAKSGEAFGQLRDYAKRVGGKAFDSNTGFAIGPGQGVRSPDAAWVSQSRIDDLTPEQRSKFWPISPNVAIEVRSESDDFRETVAKSALLVERGSSYAVAIDPATRQVVQFGIVPSDLTLDFDAIIDA